MGDNLRAAFEVMQRRGKELCDRHRAEGTLRYEVAVRPMPPPDAAPFTTFDTLEQAQSFVQDNNYYSASIMEIPPPPWYPGWTILVYRDGKWLDYRNS